MSAGKRESRAALDDIPAEKDSHTQEGPSLDKERHWTPENEESPAQLNLKASAKARLRQLIDSEVSRNTANLLGSEKPVNSVSTEGTDTSEVVFRKVKKGKLKLRRSRNSESPKDERGSGSSGRGRRTRVTTERRNTSGIRVRNNSSPIRLPRDNRRPVNRSRSPRRNIEITSPENSRKKRISQDSSEPQKNTGTSKYPERSTRKQRSSTEGRKSPEPEQTRKKKSRIAPTDTTRHKSPIRAPISPERQPIVKPTDPITAKKNYSTDTTLSPQLKPKPRKSKNSESEPKFEQKSESNRTSLKQKLEDTSFEKQRGGSKRIVSVREEKLSKTGDPKSDPSNRTKSRKAKRHERAPRKVSHASSDSDDEMKRSFDSQPTPKPIAPPEKKSGQSKTEETVKEKGKRIIVSREDSPSPKSAGPKISINISTNNHSKAQRKLAELAASGDSRKIQTNDSEPFNHISDRSNGDTDLRAIPVLTTDLKTGKRSSTDNKSNIWKRLEKKDHKSKAQKAAEDYKKAQEILSSESDSGSSPALFPLANPFSKSSASYSPVKAPKVQTWTPENAPKDLASKIRKPGGISISINTSIPPPSLPPNGMKRSGDGGDSRSSKKKKYISEGGTPNSTPRHPRISAPSPGPDDDAYGPPLPPDMEGGIPGGSKSSRRDKHHHHHHHHSSSSSSHHSSMPDRGSHRRPSKLLGESHSRYGESRYSSARERPQCQFRRRGGPPLPASNANKHRHSHRHSRHHRDSSSDDERESMRDVYKKRHDYDPEEERRKQKQAKEFDDKMQKRKRRGLPWVEQFESEKGEIQDSEGLPQEIIESLEPEIRELLEDNRFTHFFTKKYVFSNHWPCSIMLEGKTFVCTEQYYMWRKAMHFGDEDSAESILSTDDPKKIKQIGSYVLGFDQEEWDKVSSKVMTKCSKAKYVQHQELLQALFATRGTVLVETNPNDVRWGIGLPMDDSRAWDYKQWRGENKLGFILTKLRENMWVNERFADTRQAFLRNPNPISWKRNYKE